MAFSGVTGLAKVRGQGWQAENWVWTRQLLLAIRAPEYF